MFQETKVTLDNSVLYSIWVVQLQIFEKVNFQKKRLCWHCGPIAA